MPKNIVIFSDGTGQAGGINFDEARTNVYKLYRACRVGPDTKIEPSQQVTFYDPGLGSASDGGHFKIGWMRWIYNFASMATGLGCQSACKFGSDSLLMQFGGCVAL
ncbi:phospholipase effector Tle1 domain-containing protein [Bradyrhizobium japonicum]|uniref:phospholipase effector Tle1 domain-containing protein n=1 Tax=Bradyrhizobium japonicum TaxID=375 RepID=UPI003B66C75A